MAMLVVSCIAWGLTALGFTPLVMRTTTRVASDDPASRTLVFSLLVFAQGVGLVSSGPIANALLDTGHLSRARFAYGVQNYVRQIMLSDKNDANNFQQGPLLLWTGSITAFGGLISISYRNN